MSVTEWKRRRSKASRNSSLMWCTTWLKKSPRRTKGKKVESRAGTEKESKYLSTTRIPPATNPVWYLPEAAPGCFLPIWTWKISNDSLTKLSYKYINISHYHCFSELASSPWPSDKDSARVSSTIYLTTGSGSGKPRSDLYIVFIFSSFLLMSIRSWRRS